MVSISLHAGSSVDTGSGSIVLPDNPNAILGLWAPFNIALINARTGLVEGVALPASFGEGWYELVWGPLHDRLIAGLPRLLRRNRPPDLGHRIFNCPDRYPKRLFFRVTHTLEAIEGC